MGPEFRVYGEGCRVMTLTDWPRLEKCVLDFLSVECAPVTRTVSRISLGPVNDLKIGRSRGTCMNKQVLQHALF